MSALNPALYITGAGATHPAEEFRRLLAALVAEGVATDDALLVSAHGTPDMGVSVAAGSCVVAGTESPLQGAYWCTNDAAVDLAIAASHPSNPRYDLVVARVQDDEYSGTAHAWSLYVVTGTAAASPADPAVPSNALVLARVRVDADVSSIVGAKITDLRAIGPLFRLAVEEEWHVIGASGEPAFENGWGPGGAAPAFRRTGTVVRLRGALSGGSVGTSAFTLPAGYRPSTVFSQVDYAGGGGNWLQIHTAGTVTPENAVTDTNLDGLTFDTV